MSSLARQAHTFHWPGETPCGHRHRWGGELLHTVIATGHVVTTRTCSQCGSVRITRTGHLAGMSLKRRERR